MKLPKLSANLIAGLMLTAMIVAAFFSVKGDSLTMDEVSHLPAGYSYVTQKDMRINPEHPPLVKDLAGIPLLFIKGINFPYDIDAWQKDINGQWAFGFNLLYHSGNPAYEMIFWGRMPMLLILLLCGIYVFKWAKELFGEKAGLISLGLFVLSPTFLAHGRLVTTDVAAALGVVSSGFYFTRFLKSGTKKNLILAGISLGVAELAKFSTIFLLPIFAIVSIIWAIVRTENKKDLFKNIFRHCLNCFWIIVIAYFVVLPAYLFHVWNYPPERQVRDATYLLSSFNPRILVNLCVWMADKPIIRAWGQYLLGLLMVLQRASGGHTTFFMGEVSASGWKIYFPFVYLVKEPLTFHILTAVCLAFCLYKLFSAILKKDRYLRLKQWISDHISELLMLIFIGFYWLTSIKSPLNIGVRHLLPTFPLVMILVSGLIAKFLNPPFHSLKYLAFSGLMVWQLISVIKIYPHFLSYFNEMIGPENGYLYTVDSNLDWGQDLKRLNTWLEENKIPEIYVDYFGGSDASYFLGDKFRSWWGTRNPEELPSGAYLAISASSLQGGRGIPVSGFNQSWGYYNWLNSYTPVAKIGYSIFIYQIP